MDNTTIKESHRHTPGKLPLAGAWTVAANAVATGAVTIIALTAATGAGAADWQFTPNLTLSETYTDNLTLAPPGAEKADFVSEVSPGFSLTGNGPGLKLKANYMMQNLAYARETSKITINHQLNADGTAELVQDLFFLDGSATIRQANISPYGPQPVDNTNLTNNRTQTRTYSLSPYLRRQLGSTALTELRYTREAVDSSTVGLAATQSDRVLLKIDSGSGFQTLGWNLLYDGQKTHYVDSTIPDTEHRTTSGSLRYVVLPTLSLTATGGYEKNTFASIGAKPEGYFWNAGFEWMPSERTSVVSNAGRRYFGNTFSLAAKHRAQSSVWNLTYSEDITTTQSQFLTPVEFDTAALLNQNAITQIPDPVARQQFVDAYILQHNLPPTMEGAVNTLTNQVFLQKSLQASLALNGVSNTVIFSLYNTTRVAQSNANVDASLIAANASALTDDNRQTGANALWNWRIAPHTDANINLGYSRVTSLTTSLTSHNKTLRVGLSRQFQPKVKGTLELRRLQQDSSTAGVGNYRENAIAASLFMGF